MWILISRVTYISLRCAKRRGRNAMAKLVSSTIWLCKVSDCIWSRKLMLLASQILFCCLLRLYNMRDSGIFWLSNWLIISTILLIALRTLQRSLQTYVLQLLSFSRFLFVEPPRLLMASFPSGSPSLCRENTWVCAGWVGTTWVLNSEDATL